MLLAAALSLIVGITVGLLGGGGSILMVPALVYAVGLRPEEAIPTSLVAVGVTSAVAAAQHARAGHVRIRGGLAFGAAGTVGAYGGGRLAVHLPGRLLLLVFAGVMVVAGLAMLAPRTRRPAAAPGRARVGLLVGGGAAVGAVVGLVGAGGGFLAVPALALGVGMPTRDAIGTSLMIIALNSGAGLLGHLGHVDIDGTLTGVVTGAAVAGSFAGSLLAARISPRALRRAFGVLVLLMAVWILWRELVRGEGGGGGGASGGAGLVPESAFAQDPRARGGVVPVGMAPRRSP